MYLVAGPHLACGILSGELAPLGYPGLACWGLRTVCVTEEEKSLPQLKYLTLVLVPSVGVVPQYDNAVCESLLLS